MTDLAIDKAAREMEEELLVLVADAELAESRGDPDDMSWLPQWYLRQLAEVEAARDIIKENSAALLRACDAREKALAWKWGHLVNVQVDKDLRGQGGKKKSVRYLTGVAGYRKVSGREKVIVEDETKALAAAAQSCPDAIKVARSLLVSEVLNHLHKTGEILPGTRVERSAAEDRFYVGKQVLHQLPQQKLLPGDEE